jgi:5-(carboxyamino)imidazole ribonucleotide mutase
MVASITTLPVIGVPVPLTHLEGLDSLLSIVQMPAGVPVATVGIGNSKNAGLLAARIIASAGDDFGTELTKRLEAFQVDMRDVAIDKGQALKAQLANLASQDK